MTKLSLSISLAKPLLGLALALMLVGCASTGTGNFSCPAPGKGMCSPVHNVDKMVSQGQIGQDNPSVSVASNVSANQPAGDFANFSAPYPNAIITPGAPIRVDEAVMAVWLAPYQDTEGNYHEPSTIYTVVKPGGWVGQPVKEVSDTDDVLAANLSVNQDHGS